MSPRQRTVLEVITSVNFINFLNKSLLNLIYLPKFHLPRILTTKNKIKNIKINIISKHENFIGKLLPILLNEFILKK